MAAPWPQWNALRWRPAALISATTITPAFQENLQYFGTRLSKLQVDTRAVARALELYQSCCEPYIAGLFPDREAEAKAALEMLSSVSFVISLWRVF